MKKLFPFLFFGLLTVPMFGNKSKADVRYFVNQRDNYDQEIIKMTSTTSGNTLELLTTFDYSENGNVLFNAKFFDSDQNKLYFQQLSNSPAYILDKFSVYDITNDSWSTETLNNVSTDSTPNYQMIYEGDAMHTSKINNNSSNISTNTSNISTYTSNINSLGEGVAGTTALSAALTALPQTSKDSKLSCGLGTGAYSSRYAVGFGCASMLSERVDINAGGSFVFGGSKSYGGGTLDSGAVKAGFVFKLGELSKPTQISFNDKKVIDKKISTLEENNKNLNAELELSKAKNDEIISQNEKLLARLEKLENIAFKFQSSPEMISVDTKD